MPAAVRIEHGFLYDGILLDFVNLKMLGMPEMLKNLSVFIRYRNFHTNLRFPMICILYSMTETAAAAPAFRSVIFANHVVAAADLKALSVDERVRDLFSRRIVHALHGRARYAHLLGTFLLRVVFQINEPNAFVFVHRQGYLPARVFRPEIPYIRFAADVSFFLRPRHVFTSFPSYVGNSIPRQMPFVNENDIDYSGNRSSIS